MDIQTDADAEVRLISEFTHFNESNKVPNLIDCFDTVLEVLLSYVLFSVSLTGCRKVKTKHDSLSGPAPGRSYVR